VTSQFAIMSLINVVTKQQRLKPNKKNSKGCIRHNSQKKNAKGISKREGCPMLYIEK